MDPWPGPGQGLVLPEIGQSGQKITEDNIIQILGLYYCEVQCSAVKFSALQ